MVSMVSFTIIVWTCAALVSAPVAAIKEDQHHYSEYIHNGALALALALAPPQAPVWPNVFQMLMVRQRSEKISVDTLYYDW